MRLIDADLIQYEPMLSAKGNGMYEDVMVAYKSQINDLPTIEERKKGKWTMGADMPPMRHRNGKPKKFWPSLRHCSVCGHEAFDDSDWGEQLFDWCPYCGADMRETT